MARAMNLKELQQKITGKINSHTKELKKFASDYQHSRFLNDIFPDDTLNAIHGDTFPLSTKRHQLHLNLYLEKKREKPHNQDRILALSLLHIQWVNAYAPHTDDCDHLFAVHQSTLNNPKSKLSQVFDSELSAIKASGNQPLMPVGFIDLAEQIPACHTKSLVSILPKSKPINLSNLDDPTKEILAGNILRCRELFSQTFTLHTQQEIESLYQQGKALADDEAAFNHYRGTLLVLGEIEQVVREVMANCNHILQTVSQKTPKSSPATLPEPLEFLDRKPQRAAQGSNQWQQVEPTKRPAKKVPSSSASSNTPHRPFWALRSASSESEQDGMTEQAAEESTSAISKAREGYSYKQEKKPVRKKPTKLDKKKKAQIEVRIKDIEKALLDVPIPNLLKFTGNDKTFSKIMRSMLTTLEYESHLAYTYDMIDHFEIILYRNKELVIKSDREGKLVLFSHNKSHYTDKTRLPTFTELSNFTVLKSAINNKKQALLLADKRLRNVVFVTEVNKFSPVCIDTLCEQDSIVDISLTAIDSLLVVFDSASNIHIQNQDHTWMKISPSSQFNLALLQYKSLHLSQEALFLKYLNSDCISGFMFNIASNEWHKVPNDPELERLSNQLDAEIDQKINNAITIRQIRLLLQQKKPDLFPRKIEDEDNNFLALLPDGKLHLNLESCQVLKSMASDPSIIDHFLSNQFHLDLNCLQTKQTRVLWNPIPEEIKSIHMSKEGRIFLLSQTQNLFAQQEDNSFKIILAFEDVLISDLSISSVNHLHDCISFKDNKTNDHHCYLQCGLPKCTTLTQYTNIKINDSIHWTNIAKVSLLELLCSANLFKSIGPIERERLHLKSQQTTSLTVRELKATLANPHEDTLKTFQTFLSYHHRLVETLSFPLHELVIQTNRSDIVQYFFAQYKSLYPKSKSHLIGYAIENGFHVATDTLIDMRFHFERKMLLTDNEALLNNMIAGRYYLHDLILIFNEQYDDSLPLRVKLKQSLGPDHYALIKSLFTKSAELFIAEFNAYQNHQHQLDVLMIACKYKLEAILNQIIAVIPIELIDQCSDKGDTLLDYCKKFNVSQQIITTLEEKASSSSATPKR